jgi:hypothetical protein
MLILYFCGIKLQKMNSNFLKLNLSDFWKGLIMVILTAFVTSFAQFLQGWSNGTVDSAMAKVNLILSLKFAIGAGVSYLIKNFVTNSNGAVLKKDSTTTADANTEAKPDSTITTEAK